MAASPHPSLLVFDVNETLSDMSPLAATFAAAGLAEHDATAWFASVLRDAFALTVLDRNVAFKTVATEALSVLVSRTPDVDDAMAAETVIEAMAALQMHPDVTSGLQSLHQAGMRMVTLSNGAASVAQSLAERAGVAELFERFLSVEDAPAWKPDARAYGYALDVCRTPASAAMLVAVHPWDIAGAKRAGLGTAFLNRTGSHYPSYFSEPDLTTTSLSGLADALRAMA